MVPEGNVLFGIENFKKCRCRVTAEIRAKLVDLVKHEDGIARARSANVLNDLPRQSADIGPPMAPDLGFIAHAAERDTDEFAAHGSRDRPTEGSFSYTRRSHEAQDRRFTLRPQLENGQVFEDPLLNFFQIIVIAIEDFPGFDNIDFLRCQNTPRQRDQPIQVRSCHCVLGCCRRHPA